MSVNHILKKYLKDLILEFKKLKTILEFENETFNKEITKVLNFTNPRKDLILNSINNYYTTINSWLEIQDQTHKEVETLIENINLIKEEIYIIYQNSRKTMKEIYKEKSTIPKVRFSQYLFEYNNPILVDVKI
ncbi:hypothetical protein F0310_02710 [Borrelia sp. A-FGy1]|uniref:hypothetical protein n=1 Tax=Borrelia sp. A-FGy1 TaxID=2608247 RepID=UPI0015F5CFBD|nr:hypothetical protein [Borrelia sp. A-FGy1]QMU99315.1 hypothetical protein F0310_02710 [Borrelia sp. A-FGy1]